MPETVWTAPRRSHPDRKHPADPDLGQWRRPGLHPHHQHRRRLSLLRHAERREPRRSSPSRSFPYARVQRQDTPVVAGYWVFFEGMLGVARRQPCRKSTTAMSSETDRAGTGRQYRRLAGLHRQVLGSRRHSRPDPRRDHQLMRIRSSAAAMSTRPTTSPRTRSSVAAGCQRLPTRTSSYAGAKVVSTINAIGEQATRSTAST